MKIIPIAILLTSALSVNAQPQSIGIKAGMFRTDASAAERIGDTDPKVGFSGGLSYEHRLSKHFYAGADLLYQQRGFKSAVYLSNPSGIFFTKLTSRFNYNYLALPLRLGFCYGEKQLYGFASIGAMPSFLVGSNITVPEYSHNGAVIQERTYKQKNVTKFEIAGIAEVGAGYRISARYAATVSLAYQQSFTSFTNSSYVGEPSRHYGFGANLGFSYALKR